MDSRVWTIAQLAECTGATVDGDGSKKIESAAPIQSAGNKDVSFVANAKYQKYLSSTAAGAVVAAPDVDGHGRTILRHDNPYLTFATIIDLLYPDPKPDQGQKDVSAVIDPTARIDDTASIGPLCYLATGASIGKRSIIEAGTHIGPGVTIGDDCLLHPGVQILRETRIGNRVIVHAGTVIGSDGFGYAKSETGLKKIKQIGWVEIDDDVEIGANCTIDRGALGPTKIGRGTKIDNLVQIAHNVEIGEHSVIIAQVGISGSTRIGNRVVLAGQAGLVGHIEISDDVIVAAKAGISKSVPAGKTMLGVPAREIMEQKRIEASLHRLPELVKRVKELEDQLAGRSKR
ncbi:MAG: UDP-3-O-(3-hydroxymyristoyl)glucosamine N-acyltransferase [Candidatus Zixiibacteriota bacterium]